MSRGSESRCLTDQQGLDTESMSVILNFEWTKIGSVEILTGTDLVFPEAPSSPGVYRFTSGNQIYIGESSNLRRRFGGFRRPGGSPDTKAPRTNRRVNRWLLNVLGESSVSDVSVEICVGGRFGVDRISGSPLDLEVHSGRLLIENAAITEARSLGFELINL